MATKTTRRKATTTRRKATTTRQRRAPTKTKAPRRRRRASGGATLKLKDMPKELLGAAKAYGIPLAVGLFCASAASFMFAREVNSEGKSKLNWKSYAVAVAIPFALGLLLKKRFKRKDVIAATAMALLCVALWDQIGAGLMSNKLTKPIVEAGKKAGGMVNKKAASAPAAGGAADNGGVGSVVVRRNVLGPAQARRIDSRPRSGIAGNPNLANAAMRSPLANYRGAA